jgi:hypothetical protein
MPLIRLTSVVIGRPSPSAGKCRRAISGRRENWRDFVLYAIRRNYAHSARVQARRICRPSRNVFVFHSATHWQPDGSMFRTVRYRTDA